MLELSKDSHSMGIVMSIVELRLVVFVIFSCDRLGM